MKLKELFLERGALLEGHFLLSSGLHSGQYMQCALLLSDPQVAGRLGRALAKLARPCDLVVSPALGGVVIGHEVARALKVRSYFAERENGIMTLRRGFRLRPGERALVVEDVITTGKSTGEVVKLVRESGAEVTQAMSIVNRSTRELSLGVPVASLMSLPIESYASDQCPLCRKGVPVIKPGSRPLPVVRGGGLSPGAPPEPGTPGSGRPIPC